MRDVWKKPGTSFTEYSPREHTEDALNSYAMSVTMRIKYCL